MKKFGKFLFGTLSLAAAVGGIYCLYKNRINKDADFDDFDDFDDEDEDDDDMNVSADPEDREYVSITITPEENSGEEDAEDMEDAETEDTDSEEDSSGEDGSTDTSSEDTGSVTE